MAEPIETLWCVYVAVNKVIIGSGNGLVPVHHQAITWTSDDLLSIGPSGKNFNEILIKNTELSSQESAFEIVICNMVAILFRLKVLKLDWVFDIMGLNWSKWD